MSVQLHPATTLTFHRPFTQLVKRTLTIQNPNAQSIVFKVKTTAPKLYCVRPNSGTIEPRATIEVAVMLQPMKEEPPLNIKCKDKFLIQSTFIPADKEGFPPAEIWGSLDSSEEGKIQQQKLKVMYLPPEGQTVHEEEEPTHDSTVLSNGEESRYIAAPVANASAVHIPPIPELHDSKPNVSQETQASAEVQVKRPATPQLEHVNRAPTPEPLPVQAPAPSARPEPPREPTPAPAPAPPPVPAPAPVSAPPPVPAPAPVSAPAPEPVAAPVRSHTPPPPVKQRTVSQPRPQPPQSVAPSEPDHELLAKYREAQFEIERLRAVLATSQAPVELRRRNRTLVDDGSTIVGTDVSTMVDESMTHPEGVPLQYVVAIAFVVFVTTYLFF